MFALGTGNGFITLSNVKYCMPFVRQQAVQSMCADFNLINIWLTKFQKNMSDGNDVLIHCLWLVLELAIADQKTHHLNQPRYLLGSRCNHPFVIIRLPERRHVTVPWFATKNDRPM